MTEYKICSKCIMDTTDPDIIFDDQGICNHCRSYEKWKKEQDRIPAETRNKIFHTNISKIKKSGKGKKYDCLIGLSGGTDSSYVVYLAHQHNLRALVVHLDNGWNSEQAVNNIKNIVSHCNYDFYTHVINWEEFKDLQRSFFKASVVDIEILTDQAISAMMQKLARKHGIKWVISGSNRATEFIMPKKWVHMKMDYINVKAIQKKFGTRKIKTFPLANLWSLLNKQFSLNLGLNIFKPLNFVEYNKLEAKKILTREFGWKDYGEKHYESVFTKFYQAYYLPEKFNIDKRKAHYSTLINSGLITREQALEQIKKPLYDPDELRIEKDYVLKKLDFSDQEFEEITNDQPKSHLDYPNIYTFFDKLEKLKKRLTAK
ncbi:N-acetyl sugar amidotransferase [Bacteroidota bacterium]